MKKDQNFLIETIQKAVNNKFRFDVNTFNNTIYIYNPKERNYIIFYCDKDMFSISRKNNFVRYKFSINKKIKKLIYSNIKENVILGFSLLIKLKKNLVLTKIYDV